MLLAENELVSKFCSSLLRTNAQCPPKIGTQIPGIDDRLQLKSREFSLVDYIRGERQGVPNHQVISNMPYVPFRVIR